MYYRDYIQFCEFSRNLSTTTVQNYATVLSMWSQFLGENGILAEKATAADVLRFMTEKHVAGVRPSSINQYLTTIASYYSYCVRFHHDVMTSNPCNDVQPMKDVKRLPVCIPRRILDRVVSEMRDDTFARSRSRAILLIMYHCGLRRSEVLGLSDECFDYENQVVRVLGKGAKVRIVPMSQTLVHAMLKYVGHRSALAPWINRTFVTRTGENLSRSELAVIVRSALCRYVSREYCYPHILRHSFATACLEAGVSIENISALLGHTSIATTQRYLSISPSRLLSQIQGVF